MIGWNGSGLFARRKFSTKLLLAICVPVLLSCMFLGGYMIMRANEDALHRLDEKGATIQNLLAKISAVPLITRDYWSLEDYIKEVLKDPEVSFAVIYDRKKKPVTKTAERPEEEALPALRVYRAPVIHNEKEIGAVEVGITTARYREEMKSNILVLAGIVALTLACGFGVALLVARAVTRPVQKITQVMAEAGKGDLSATFANDRLLWCWDTFDCGREDCAAYGNMENRCWDLVGNLTRENHKGTLPSGMNGCRECKVYRLSTADEVYVAGEGFNTMMVGMREIFSQVTGSAVEVLEASKVLLALSEEMKEGIDTQAESLARVSGLINDMTTRIEDVSLGAEHMFTVADESAGAGAEMAAFVDQEATNAERLATLVEQITASIQTMSGSIAKVAAKEDRLSHQLTSSSSSMNELDSSIKEVEGSARQARELSEQVADSFTREGQESVKATKKGVSKSRDVVLQSAQRVRELEKKSKNINEIVTVIDEVTTQTELLSLNASIIAAQAGVHGRGFAVVAGQIKNLSVETSKSTHAIVDLVTNVQSEVAAILGEIEQGSNLAEESVKLIGEVDATLQKVLSATGEAAESARRIATSTGEQAGVIRQLSKSEQEMADLAREITEFTRSQVGESEKIMSVAEDIRAMAGELAQATLSQSRSTEKVRKGGKDITGIAKSFMNVMKNESKACEAIVESLREIKRTTSENIAAVDKLDEMTSSLTEQSRLLHRSVSRFKIDAESVERLL